MQLFAPYSIIPSFFSYELAGTTHQTIGVRALVLAPVKNLKDSFILKKKLSRLVRLDLIGIKNNLRSAVCEQACSQIPSWPLNLQHLPYLKHSARSEWQKGFGAKTENKRRGMDLRLGFWGEKRRRRRGGRRANMFWG